MLISIEGNMAKKEILGFFKNAKDNIDDCSSPIQLRGYFNKYRGKVMHDDIRREFLSRIDFFKRKFEVDRFYIKQIESLLEDIEFDTTASPEFINIENHNNIDITAFDASSESYCPVEEDLLKELFVITNGLKSEVLRVLNTNSFILGQKIDMYSLAPFISKLRKEHKSGQNLATQFPDT